MLRHSSTMGRTRIVCSYSIIVASILAWRANGFAEQPSVDTIVGDWLVEETRDVAPYVHQSGRDGLASVLLAPLDPDIHKNTFFSMSCLNGRVYLNVDTLTDRASGKESEPDVTAILDGFIFSTKDDDAGVYRHSYVEHGTLKAEVGEDFLQSFISLSPTTISLTTEYNNISFVYNNKERARAINLFLDKCGNIKLS